MTPSTRIIPADAGSTQGECSEIQAQTDHPRGCGEHGDLFKDGGDQAGSSPRMRGARDGDLFDQGGRGIIPADAGSTVPSDHMSLTSEDHPRGCGEHCELLADLVWFPGSSPRMRGARCMGHG